MTPSASCPAPSSMIPASAEVFDITLFVRGGESRYNKVIVDGVTINEPGGTFDFGTLLARSGRPYGVRPRRPEHPLRLRRYDQRSASLDPRRHHARAGINVSAPTVATSQPPRDTSPLAGARGRASTTTFSAANSTPTEPASTMHMRTLLEGANVGAALNDSDFAVARALPSFQQSYRRRSRRMGFQWIRALGPANAASATGASQLNPTWSQSTICWAARQLAVTAPHRDGEHRFTGFDYLYRYNELNANGDAARGRPLGRRDRLSFSRGRPHQPHGIRISG